MSKRMYRIGQALFWLNVICAIANALIIPVDVVYGSGIPAIAMNSSCIVVNILWAVVIRHQLRDVTSWERARW